MTPSKISHRIQSSLLLLIFCYCAATLGGNVTWIRIKFGVILPVDDDRPFSIQKCFSAIKLTFLSPRVKNLLPHVNFSAYSGNSKCNSIAAPLAAFGLMDVEKVHVIFGPVCDYSLAPVARYSPYWNVPVITPGGMATDFGKGRMSNTSEFRLLTRVGINFDDLAHVTHKVLKTFGWDQVKILYSSDGYSEVSTKFCYLAVSAIVQYFKKMGIETDEHTFEQDEEDEDMAKLLLKHIGNEHTVIILCNSPDSVRELMIIAHQLNFDNGEYVFINLDPFSSKRMLETPWLRGPETQARNNMAKMAFQSLLIITLSQPRGEDYMRFAHAVRNRANAFFNETVFESDEDVNIYAALFHDAVLLYAHALNETLADGYGPSDGDVITSKMRNRTIDGLSGKFKINKKGDRSMDFSLLDMNPNTTKFVEVGAYSSSDRTFRLRKNRKIHWGGANPERVPNGTLTCGHDNALCPRPESFPSYGIILISVVIVACITISVSWFFFKENQRKKSRRNLNWQIKWEDILFEVMDGRRFEKRNPTSVGKHVTSLRGSLSSLLTCDSTVPISNDDIMTKIGSYKGNRVSIRKISKTFNMSKGLSKQLETMKNLQDDHIVRFVGMCIDPPNVCIVTQFCHKRKLKDLLADGRVNLDIMFKYSLIQDIVMGMAYLHGSDIHSHGNLNTYNCVVDSRFVLKITNFGLQTIIDSQPESEDQPSNYQDQLWMAPELLRADQRPSCGTQKGDVYGFAIICQEILYRRGPFWIEDSCLSVHEIIKLVRKGDLPYTRPTLMNNSNQDGFNSELVQLVARCWAENPAKRPDFHGLKWQLKRCISSGKVSGTSLLDNILSRLEQYAQNLEILVEEKTKDYLDQKRRAEEILYTLLPRSVAEQLMIGGRVKAEKFESVTICFCDICGFTALSAASSPMEVVTMLNDLYTKFDCVIDTFDVYKVETIGDAYMVVSGLNQHDTNEHAAEISRMALALGDVIKSFQIAHMPQERLKLRTGIHSGPVCAGVVGRKMPRYCLFGDTVNTAITIQALAEPLTIHVSNHTKVILEDSDEFEFKERGVIFLAGKGDMTTWWLAGMKTVDRPTWRIDDDSRWKFV